MSNPSEDLDKLWLAQRHIDVVMDRGEHLRAQEHLGRIIDGAVSIPIDDGDVENLVDKGLLLAATQRRVGIVAVRTIVDPRIDLTGDTEAWDRAQELIRASHDYTTDLLTDPDFRQVRPEQAMIERGRTHSWLARAATARIQLDLGYSAAATGELEADLEFVLAMYTKAQATFDQASGPTDLTDNALQAAVAARALGGSRQQVRAWLDVAEQAVVNERPATDTDGQARRREVLVHASGLRWRSSSWARQRSTSWRTM